MQEAAQPPRPEQTPPPILESWADYLRLIPRAVAESELTDLGNEAFKVLPPEMRPKIAAVGELAIAAAHLKEAQMVLNQKAEQARFLEINWSDIARIIGITQPAARRRFDPEARRQHSEYRRKKSLD
jgi:hypothetical protein